MQLSITALPFGRETLYDTVRVISRFRLSQTRMGGFFDLLRLCECT